MAPKPRSEQHKAGLYYAREAGFRHSEVRILPPQPASPVSMEHLRFERKAVTVAGLSVSAIGLRSAKIFHLLALERNFRASLCSRIFNIRFLKVETRFDSHETGSITAR
jgi:hypothetical protein